MQEIVFIIGSMGIVLITGVISVTVAAAIEWAERKIINIIKRRKEK